MKHIIYILFMAFLQAYSPVYAQQWEIGAIANGTVFMGDINPTNPFYFRNVGAGVHVVRNFNATWGVQASYQYVQLRGSDIDSKDPYLHARGQVFNNSVQELSVRANFNFFKFIAGRALNRYTPYTFAGLAGIIHNPYVYSSNGTRHYLQDLHLQENNEIRKFALAIPIGIGFKYNVKGPWSVGGELGYRVVFNDNLDNISNNYPYRSDYPADYAAQYPELTREWWDSVAYPNTGSAETYEGKARGNGRPNDGYLTAGVTVIYTIISKKCEWWN